MTETQRRVKLYALNADRQWVDRGTGYVTSSYVDRLKGVSIQVRAEADGTLLLESKIHPDTAYQKQLDTLIVWSGDNFDYALSFQEKDGCDEIWENICQVQGKDPSLDITQDVVDDSEDERSDDTSDSPPPVELPPCELSRLGEINELIGRNMSSSVRKQKLASAIENEDYIRKLLNLFHMCEDLGDKESLHYLHTIFKNIFLLNKNSLFEIMFEEEIIFDVIGCLEYDPSCLTPQNHRQYLKEASRFKEAVPIRNAELLAKIHQTFRAKYIQDVILPTPSLFEENMLPTLSSFIYFNKLAIVNLIQEDEKFLNELFMLLTDESTDNGKRRNLILFVKEFCNFSQNLLPPGKELFFKTLYSLGILPALEIALEVDDSPTKAASIDILTYIVEFSPSVVRCYTLQQLNNTDEDQMLINIIIEQMVCDTDPELGVTVQLMGILKVLLDPENMLASVNKFEKSEFLNFFYKHSVHILVAPILANTVEEFPSKEDYQTVQLLSHILEILSFCVEHHTYHMKDCILNKDLLRRVLVLVNSSHTFLALSAIRFMRKIISLKDEFYNRYIIKGNLFAPVVNAYLRNCGRYNMMDSAVLEMFEFIRSENIKSLCLYAVEQFGKVLNHIGYIQTFTALKLRYEQHIEKMKDKERKALGSTICSSVPSILRNSRYRRDQRQPEVEEELWFNEDDDTDYDEDVVSTTNDELGKKSDSEESISSRRKHGNMDGDSHTSPTKCRGTANANNKPSSTSDVSKSSATSYDKSVATVNKALVDYEGDSDEEECNDLSPSPKRARAT
ncbi:serine/threonine-protein phosphatase 4 regulatory subunit 3-like [Anabrus simplex]|uniref:serine/threonine-protein phosphatase 4 regulatory subunit 3-like n=1 Tax=Anabrus simplex TaxID=316456 RepID=UPI0035A3AC99